jgi:undecaprenyl-diphosphatase
MRASLSESVAKQARADAGAISDTATDGFPPAPFDRMADATGRNVARRGQFPPVATLEVFVAAYVTLTAVMLAVGTLITRWWVPSGLGHWDESVNQWFADHRTPFLNHVTAAATFMANTGAVVVIAAVAAAVMLLLHRWRNALVLGVALVLEVTVFLSITFTIARPRPDVVRLDSTPSTDSFPSGHIAASLVLWGGVALCALTFRRRRVAMVVAWCIAVMAPLAIGFARVYRGMHHWTDVGAGGFLGLAALTAGVVAERATSAAVAARARRREPLSDDRGAATSSVEVTS